jgi:sterol desaturase/sphingolipid hydroxylase (fatty acid hydroxylase superfamily)
MDLLASGMIELRLSLFLGLAVLLLALEWVMPFRAPVQSKLHHVSTNLVILGVNALALQFLVGWALLLWSSYVGSEAWGLLHRLRLEPISHVLLSVILLDLIYYGAHRLNHLVPFLWRFHRATIVIWTWM